MTEFLAFRPKLYSYEKLDGSEDKKCKGVKKCVVKKTLTFEDYKACLFNDSMEYRGQPSMRFVPSRLIRSPSTERGFPHLREVTKI